MAIEKINLIDVGGLGGVQPEWHPHLDRVRPVVFEPNPSEASSIRPAIEAVGGIVVQKALGSSRRAYKLNETASLGCTSILTPNYEFLRAYSVAPAFEVRKTHVVECVRYDEMRYAGDVPRPDVIKIDVQGFELEVLRGFGASLDDCLGMQIEAHFYPLYEGQPLIGDLIAYLFEFGLTLRKLQPVDHFDKDVVEVDAYFTINKNRVLKLDNNRRAELRLIEQVWGLPERQPIFSPDQFRA